MIKLDSAQARAILMATHGMGGRASDPFDAIARQPFVQTQYANTLPVSVAVRSKVNDPAWFEKEIQPGGRLVKGWTVRHTLHTMLEDDYELQRAAIGEEFALRFLRWYEKDRKMAQAAIADRHGRILDVLSAGPKTRKEVNEALPELNEMENRGWGNEGTGGGWPIDFICLSYQGKVGMCSHTGPTAFYARVPCAHALCAEDARAELLRRYFRAYGMGRPTDIKVWGSFYAPFIKGILDRMQGECFEVEVNGLKGFRALEEMRGLIENPPEPPLVAIGAKFDTSMFGHKDRSWFLADEFKKRVSKAAGQVEAPIFVRGEICGTWRSKIGAKSIDFDIDRFPIKWTKAMESAMGKEFERLAKSLGRTVGSISG